MTPEQIEQLLSDHKESTKMLLRRDLELSRANEQLRSLDQEKSEFVSIAAHQLRTPLSAIRWAHQMLIDEELGPLNDKQKNMLEQSQKSIERMVNLVNDLLSADHLEFRQVIYEFTRINLNHLISEVVDELAPMAQERNITLTLHLSDHSTEVVADPKKLKEAGLNILNNAIKYSPPGSIVIVMVKTVDDGVVITFSDQGIGIPVKDHKRIFKKFSRSDNAKKVDADGSGLGLFIVKKIIEAHDGSITFNSDEGGGTVFTVTLPVNV